MNLGTRLPFASLAFALLLSAPAALADGDERGGDDQPTTRISVLGTLARIDRQGPHSVSVKGTCNEGPVRNFQLERVTLQSAPGQVAVIAAPDHNRPVISIRESSSITISGFDLSGGNIGVFINASSPVAIDSVAIHDNLVGMVVRQRSNLSLIRSSVNHNRNNGISVGESRLSLDHVELAGNAGHGMIAGYVSSTFANEVTARDNGQVGVWFSTSSALALTASRLENNGVAGLRVSENSHAELNGGNVIRGNGAADPTVGGVYVARQAELTFNGQNEISGNAGPGVHAVAHSTLSSAGGTDIHGNGGANLRCKTESAIFGDPGTKSEMRCRRDEDDSSGAGARDDASRSSALRDPAGDE